MKIQRRLNMTTIHVLWLSINEESIETNC